MTQLIPPPMAEHSFARLQIAVEKITRTARSDGAPDRLGSASGGIFLAASPSD